MYNIKILNYEKQYLLDELIKVFLQPKEYILVDEDFNEDLEGCIVFNRGNYGDRDAIKREIYDVLSQITGKMPEWGILTGIRPVKLAGEYFEKSGSIEKTRLWLKEHYYISDEKIQLIISMYRHQYELIGKADNNSASVYIGIPFCPTRCLYCSFASNQVDSSEIDKYLEALHREIASVGNRMKECGIKPETVYIGGGTPTTLTAGQLHVMIDKIYDAFDMSTLKEFTVEAGRPDTITCEKLQVLKDGGVNRISINPQSMKNSTLEKIGRSHNRQQIIDAFHIAQKIGFDAVNADVIAGLPGESSEDFRSTLKQVNALGAENITVHCLAVKRASRLIAVDENFHYKQAGVVSEMLADSRTFMAEKGYRPYYLYRQKHMAGAYENTGYTKEGKDCVYNMRIMDEHQTIIALGAGGISKAYYPLENRLERVPNVTNYQEYISRVDEMIERKENNIFKEVKNANKCT